MLVADFDLPVYLVALTCVARVMSVKNALLSDEI